MLLDSIPIVGIIGSIGSGKSTVAEAVAERLGGCRLDADAAGHAVLQEPQVRQRLREEFGEGIFNENGDVNRSALARIVFGETAEHGSARSKLEFIVHPRIREHLRKQIDQAARSGNCTVVLLDAAVMLESKWDHICDLIVCLDAARPVRVQRVAARNWSEEELDRRERSQISMDEKRARADLTVDNSGELEPAVQQIAAFLNQRLPNLKSDALQDSPR